ncbi:hypothetical protein QR680_001421 [Steinernema hermaphroditum]|uniref:acid phosphatase n=1 Tax=Steinernema hermaphroditum TaxID=289476 RepID=A0AA39GZT9_9BILA|nr:hypothetical protein QR680_001421 [Steinernema hermaphroditum]
MRSPSICVWILSCLVACAVAKDKLIFLQAVWRHGDRSPTDEFRGDRYNESSWHLGLGELTARGMEQHLYLGKHLRQHFFNKEKYDFGMNHRYENSHEIYIRATDVNRTIISAMSNMIGFYNTVNGSYNKNPNQLDYPENDAWPAGFIPIAVHNTIPYDNDFEGNPDAECTLQHQVWDEVKKSEIYTNLTEANADLLDYLNEHADFNVTLDSLWVISDDLYIQNVSGYHFPSWINESLFERIYALNDIVEDWQNGLSLNGLKIEGQDASTLIKQCRGGTLVWSLINHMKQKISCSSKPDDYSCRWINPLYYRVVSAHDTTLAALLTALGSKRNVVAEGYPHYSAATTFELIEEDNKYYVRATYFRPNLDNLNEVDPIVFTGDIHGCDKLNITDGKCPLETIATAMQSVLPPHGLDIQTYCNKGLAQFTPSTPTTTPKSSSSSRGLTTVIFFAILSYLFVNTKIF